MLGVGTVCPPTLHEEPSLDALAIHPPAHEPSIERLDGSQPGQFLLAQPVEFDLLLTLQAG